MMYNKRMVYVKRRRRIRWIPFTLFLALIFATAFFLLRPYIFKQEEAVVVEEPTENTVVGVDTNQNGLSDIEDIVIGARIDALNLVEYINAYYNGGYPPETEGTCTDLVWRAFDEAGLSLKDMVDADIAANPGAYPNALVPDPNIDFRRVGNLYYFFLRNALELTTDVYETDQWQAGDIVIFGNMAHIGIVSDIRNDNDIPFLIHNNDQPIREEDRLEYGSYTMGITGHFRWISSVQ